MKLLNSSNKPWHLKYKSIVRIFFTDMRKRELRKFITLYKKMRVVLFRTSEHVELNKSFGKIFNSIFYLMKSFTILNFQKNCFLNFQKKFHLTQKKLIGVYHKNLPWNKFWTLFNGVKRKIFPLPRASLLGESLVQLFNYLMKNQLTTHMPVLTRCCCAAATITISTIIATIIAFLGLSHTVGMYECIHV
jgi:hypothetical protein